MAPENVSRLIEQARIGDPNAFDLLITEVYQELRCIAGALLRDSVNGRTLQPTALVNEAWLRLNSGRMEWENKAHFFGAAARAMRQVLCEEARRRSTRKRAGGIKRVTLQDLAVQAPDPSLDLLALDQALTALAEVGERYTRFIELRYFAGCSLEEIAELTGYSLATVKRDWAYARAWLYQHMQDR